MKRFTPVLVTWHDSNGSAEWLDERDVVHAPNIVLEVGLFFRQDATGLTTVKAIDKVSGHVHGQSFIPATNIISVVKLEEKQ